MERDPGRLRRVTPCYYPPVINSLSFTSCHDESLMKLEDFRNLTTQGSNIGITT